MFINAFDVLLIVCAVLAAACWAAMAWLRARKEREARRRARLREALERREVREAIASRIRASAYTDALLPRVIVREDEAPPEDSVRVEEAVYCAPERAHRREVAMFSGLSGEGRPDNSYVVDSFCKDLDAIQDTPDYRSIDEWSVPEVQGLFEGKGGEFGGAGASDSWSAPADASTQDCVSTDTGSFDGGSCGGGDGS